MAYTQSNEGFSTIRGIQDFLESRLGDIRDLVDDESGFDMSEVDFEDGGAYEVYMVAIKVGTKHVRKEAYGTYGIGASQKAITFSGAARNAKERIAQLEKMRSELVKARNRLYKAKSNAPSRKLDARIPSSWTIYIGYLDPSEMHVRYDGRELPYALLIPMLMSKGYDPLLPLRDGSIVAKIRAKMQGVISGALEKYSRSAGYGNPAMHIRRGMEKIAREAKEIAQNYIAGSEKPVMKAALSKNTVQSRISKDKKYPGLYPNGVDEPLSETGMLANDIRTSVEESGSEELATKRASIFNAYIEVCDKIKEIDNAIRELKESVARGAKPKTTTKRRTPQPKAPRLSTPRGKAGFVRSNISLKLGGYKNALKTMMGLRNSLIEYKNRWNHVRKSLGGDAWKAEANREGRSLLKSVNDILSAVGLPPASGINTKGRIVVRDEDGAISPYQDNRTLREFLDAIGFIGEI